MDLENTQIDMQLLQQLLQLLRRDNTYTQPKSFLFAQMVQMARIKNAPYNSQCNISAVGGRPKRTNIPND